MKRICSWCGNELGIHEKYEYDGDITHGVCSPCAIDFTKDETRTAREILELIAEPIFIIDDSGRVKAANSAGAQMLNKELDTIENEMGGDAFECAYARLEGGCGNTVHCKTCSIRNTVMDTLNTGQGYTDIPAYQSIWTENGEEVIKFTISTEKTGNRILLRIDRIG